MSRTAGRRPRLVVGAILGVWAVAASLAGARSQPQPSDSTDRDEVKGPVGDLRRALRELPPPVDKAGRDSRTANLKKHAENITSLTDLARALVLPDWRYADRDIELARVDGMAWDQLADRFRKAVNKT